MRRRRQALQVTTFPFLAVLLCTLGSLILLLLVMDRRAKIVAQQKAQQARETATAKNADQLAARQAEWERQRQELHRQLEEQEQNLRQQAAMVQQDTTATDDQLAKVRQQLAMLQQRLAEETLRLNHERQTLAQRQAGVAQADDKEKNTRGEIHRLASELLEMERTLRELQKLKQRERQTYSLIPYRGKRGDDRKPLYLECSSRGLIIHPDRVALDELRLSTPNLRSELEKRLGPLPSLNPKADLNPLLDESQPTAKAYLMFLIRPDGIPIFYQSQAALRGVQVDYGYEFVEADWVLDFSSDQVADASRWPTPHPASPGAGPKGFPSNPPTAGKVVGIRLHDPRLTNQGNPSGPGMNGSEKPLMPGKNSVGVPAQPMGLFPNMPGGPPSRIIAQTSPGPSRSEGDKNGPLGRPTFNGTNDPMAKPLVPTFPGAGMNAPQTNAQEKSPTPPPHEEEGQKDKRGAPTAPTVEKDKETKLGKPGPTAEQPDPVDRLAPPPVLAAAPKPQRPPPPLGHIIGNRDFPIIIECTATRIVVLPGGATFTEETLRQAQRGDNSLGQNIRQLIARRQAGVQQGEPSYRPFLRFRIHPDGLRTYYLAYPLLEPLRLSMTRENLE